MEKISKSKAEWKKILSELSYEVTRNSATERPFSKQTFPKAPGRFCCICCDLALFSSEKKYESGSGWPSFYAALNKDAILEKVDKSHNMERVEVLCARCDAHLGHLFPDGPKPTGLRYCINGAALSFKSDSKI
ncbi:MAG: peptide-methionine (R)-S-oxide reductase MsrB [Pseudomonadota bacterium]|nr:peptide-methionine (R)-S-oxide reductase MsrB [Pseudomonadota bacterium]